MTQQIAAQNFDENNPASAGFLLRGQNKGGVTVVANASPVRNDPVIVEFPAGKTIAEVLGADPSHSIRVEVGGIEVPRELWKHLRPKAGQMIHVTVYPQGGGGKLLRSVLMIAVIVASIYTGGLVAAAYGTTAAAATGTAALAVSAAEAGVMIVGMMAVNALVPPPRPSMSSNAGGQFTQLQSITGTSNQANQYGVIPCVVGKMRYFPPHAAMPYTEILGDDQYLRMLLDLGYGDLDVSDIRIGDTPIEQYEDVQYEVSATPTLFTQDVNETQVGFDMSTDGTSATRTTQTATTEISLDLVFPQGLFCVGKNGNTQNGSVTVSIQYAPTGTTNWQDPSTNGANVTSSNVSASGTSWIATSSARKTLRCGVRWDVPVGTYDVRVTRVSSSFVGAANADSKADSMSWTVLRSISPQNPSTTGTTKLAVRIKASDQLNGMIQNLSVLSAQKVPTWDTASQTWGQNTETENPAWIYAWLMTRCPAIQRRLADSRLDLNGIAAWAAECDSKGYVCSFVMDSARALSDVLSDVLASGRASFGVVNGLYGAVRDVPQAVPVQMFTPANSSNFQYQRSFAPLPHGLRVQFTNPQANYQQDEITVYAPGYTSETATLFETLQLMMVTDPDAAWRLGMYHLAVGYYRPTTYTLTADVEHIVCERGDLVRVAHDITEWGQAWGRIKEVDVSNSQVTLDGSVDLANGQQYQLQIRRQDGSIWSSNVTNAAGDNQALITLSSAPLATDDGALFVLGTVAHGTADLIVNSVEPQDDLSATLTLLDAAPQVWSADAGTPPTFVSAITSQAWCAAPDAPQLDLVPSGTTDTGGVFHPGIGVSNQPIGGIYRPGPHGIMQKVMAR